MLKSKQSGSRVCVLNPYTIWQQAYSKVVWFIYLMDFKYIIVPISIFIGSHCAQVCTSGSLRLRYNSPGGYASRYYSQILGRVDWLH